MPLLSAGCAAICGRNCPWRAVRGGREERCHAASRAALITILIMNAPGAVSPWDGWVSFFAPPLSLLHEQAQNLWLININRPYRFINDKQIYVSLRAICSWDEMRSFPPRGSWDAPHALSISQVELTTFQIASSWCPSALHLNYRCCVGGDLLTRNKLKFLNSTLLAQAELRLYCFCSLKMLAAIFYLKLSIVCNWSANSLL